MSASFGRKSIIVGLIAFGFTQAPQPAFAATSSLSEEAIAVCASQREPITRLRDRYREQIGDAVIRGVAVGVLGGALLGAAATRDPKDQGKGAIIGGILGGIAGGVDQYVEAKRAITNDNRELSRLIDSDARAYVGNVSSIAAAINATGKCRENQIATWEQRLVATRTEAAARQASREAALAAATDDASRKAIERDNKKAAQGDGRVLDQMNKENAVIKAAIEDDKRLYQDVIKFFDQDILKMAEADAMVQGTSTASIRGSAEGYVVEVIPPALMADAGNLGASSSAFGSSASAFGAPKPTVVAQAPAAAKMQAGSVPPWQAQVKRPVLKAENGHQAALVAERNVTADASAVTQSNLARLQYANMQGAAIQVPN